jgi:endonuclease YncB( thermonuclease family)
MVDERNLNSPRKTAETDMITWQKAVYFLAGAAAGALVCALALLFPGGRGEGRRLDLTFREGATYRVRRVVDGDTIVIEPGVYVRYAGVSAPETKQVVAVERPFGRESSDCNRQLVEGRQVRLRFGERKMDGYGRLLACVEVRAADGGDWRDVGEELARRGLVRSAYKAEGAPNRERVSRAVEEARSAGRGIWSSRGRRRR